MHVEVVYALPDQQHCMHLELAPGATVAEALSAVGRVSPFSGLDLEAVPVGIFGRLVKSDEVLQSDDRVEVYRPLLVDPKELRRLRAANARKAEKGE